MLPLLLIIKTLKIGNQGMDANKKSSGFVSQYRFKSGMAMLIYFLNTLDFRMLLQHLTSEFRQ